MNKFLHTRVRVSDLDRSINWYCEHLGFKVRSRSDSSPAGNHIAHLELPGNKHTLELTWSEDYDLNVQEDLMHFAVGLPDLFDRCEEYENKGIEVWPDNWRKNFSNGRKVVFITDPDNYEIEIAESKESKRFLHTRVRVSDLDRSINWYCEHLGFKVRSRSDSSPAGNHVSHLELPGNKHGLELTWSEDYDLNVQEDLMHFAIGVPNINAVCEEYENKGIEVWPDNWRDAFSEGRKMAFITDPDNYEVELLERK